MKRFLLPASAAATALVAAVPGTALAKPPTKGHARAYEHAYHEVAHKLGHRVPGRNIIKDGVAHKRAATDAETVKSLHVLQRMLAPAPAPTPASAAAVAPSASTTSSVAPAASTTSSAAPSASTASATAPAASSASSAGASGVPACASESGTNYSTGASNTNASSGATGRYQILPSTAAAYGCSLATPAGQDACAQTIYQHQGASAWVGCGG